MDVKQIPSKPTETFSDSESVKSESFQKPKKRQLEDVFEPTFNGPASKRMLQNNSALEEPHRIKKFGAIAETRSSPESATTLRTLEQRLAQMLKIRKEESKATSDLATMAQFARERGLPLAFTLDMGLQNSVPKDAEILPFSYNHFKGEDFERATLSASPVYIFLAAEEKAYHIGSAKDHFSRQHPTMGYVPTFNEVAMSGKEEQTSGLMKYAGMGFLIFHYGIGIPTNAEVAANFLRLIPENERKETFGKLLVESLLERQYSTALLCVPHSEGIYSFDDEGAMALVNALRPEAEEVLRKLVSDTKEKDLAFLAGTKKYALFADYPRAAQILEDHAGTLGFTLDKE